MFVNKGCSRRNEVSKEVETRRRWEQSFRLGSQESREEKRGHKDILVKKKIEYSSWFNYFLQRNLKSRLSMLLINLWLDHSFDMDPIFLNLHFNVFQTHLLWSHHTTFSTTKTLKCCLKWWLKLYIKFKLILDVSQWCTIKIFIIVQ
jgi:hypothetical protein